jgi:EpsI family protein
MQGNSIVSKLEGHNVMVKFGESHLRPAIVAAVVASCLMLVFGLTYRVVAARLDAPIDTTPISPDALTRFPLQIGDWTGVDVPMDEAIARATDTDARLNRRYTRRGGFESLTFYIASGVRARDLMPHRPEVCYTGAGWTLTNRRLAELPLGDSTVLPCNIMQFSRGVLNAQTVVVLDYYLVNGQYCADVSLLRWKACLGSGRVRYVAQIQIVTPITATFNAEAAIQMLRSFAVESAALTAALFDDPRTKQNAGEPNEPPQEP